MIFLFEVCFVFFVINFFPLYSYDGILFMVLVLSLYDFL